MSAHGQLEEKSQSKQEEELDESKDKENNDLKLECDVCGLYANETPEKNLYYCNLCANGNKLSEFRILCMKHGIDTHGRRSTHKFEKLNIKLANKSFNEPIQVANDYKEKFHNAVVLYTESKLKGEKETQKAIEKIKKSFTQVTKHSYVTDGLATTAVMVADGLTTADGAVYSTAGVNMTMEFLQSNHFPVTTETSAESVASFGTCAQDVLVNKISLICYPIVFGLEALYFGYKYCSGKISSKEFFYRLTKSVLRAGGAIGSSYGIVAAGIAMGVFAGPVGLIVGGIIGAIAGGAIVSYSCEKIWKWATKKWPWLMKSERVSIRYKIIFAYMLIIHD